MSSNIRVKRICEYCNNDFEARKTTSKTCSERCARMNYKRKKREEKIIASNKETFAIKSKKNEQIKMKEFLTVKDLSILLCSSTKTVYNLIERGNIKAINLAQRKTLIKRSEIDKLFE